MFQLAPKDRQRICQHDVIRQVVPVRKARLPTVDSLSLSVDVSMFCVVFVCQELPTCWSRRLCGWPTCDWNCREPHWRQAPSHTAAVVCTLRTHTTTVLSVSCLVMLQLAFTNQPTYLCAFVYMWNCVFDHPQSGVVYNFGRFCLSVCLSDDNFLKPWRRKFIKFAYLVYLQGVRVKFVYEGHRVRVKVTGAKGSTAIQYSCNGNLRASTNSDSRGVRAVKYACSMWFLAKADRMVWPLSLLHDQK